MSVIQKIRDKGAWILFGGIALALIAFILQDASKQPGGNSQNTTLGTVNGQAIDRNEYQDKLTFFDNMSKQRGQQMPHSILTGQVWNYLVQEALLNQEVAKLGIGFTGNELADLLFGDNPPQWMQQQFTDPKTGVFNAAAARQAFAQIKKTNDAQSEQVNKQFIEPTVQQTLFQKYTALVSGAVYIPKWMAEKTNADNSAIAKASYVYVPYNTINDSSVTVTDAQINAYVQKHEKQFKRDEEGRTVQYIGFSENASTADSTSIKQQIEALKTGFETTTDVKNFVVSKSTDGKPYTETYLTKDNFSDANSDTIITLAPGQVYGPYTNNGVYELAKMVGKRTVPDSATARHILIKTAGENGTPILADSIAKKRIDSIAAAIQGGADFNLMVLKYSDDEGSKTTGGQYTFPYSQFKTISPEFAQTIFYEPVGAKKTVKVATQGYSGYHYIEVLKQQGSQTAYNIAYVSKPILASSETIGAASSAASQFASSSRTKADFEANAKKIGKVPLTSPEIKSADYSIGALGGENRDFVKWVYKSKVGDISDPAEMGDQYIVAMVTGVDKAGVPSAQSVRPMVESIVRNENKAKTLIAKIKGTTLEEVASSAGVSVQTADSLSFQSTVIPGAGNEPKVVGAAFNKETVAKISAAIAGNSGVYVVKSGGVSAVASLGSSPDQTRESIKNMITQQQQNTLVEGLRKAATIKDERGETL